MFLLFVAKPFCVFCQHVGVQANVVDVRTGHEETTNDFRFTWCPDDGAAVVRGVVPNTYRGMEEPLSDEFFSILISGIPEAMLWLEGKRALEMGDQIRGERSSK
jgi:acyl-coenzyme A thioesterase 9